MLFIIVKMNKTRLFLLQSLRFCWGEGGGKIFFCPRTQGFLATPLHGGAILLTKCLLLTISYANSIAKTSCYAITYAGAAINYV